MDKYCPHIGEATGSSLYKLDLSDFVRPLNPPSQYNLEPINPEDYFITSGDAVQKTQYLCDVLWRNAGKARRQLHRMKEPTAEAIEFEKECWRQAGACKRMLNALIRARGDFVFLETEWNAEHELLCIPKNPRSIKNKACQVK